MRLIERLASFNRKERFYLIGWALGNQQFTLSSSFRQELGEVLGLSIPVDAYAAMDYHLDWIYASLFLSAESARSGPYENQGQIGATQEDVDLLVAFELADQTHLVMLEAKGATGWTNAQLAHKAGRLRAIFAEDGRTWELVTRHFIIASPAPSAKLVCDTWPAWMTPKPQGKPLWLQMPMPATLQRVTRCDPTGCASVSGKYWTVVP